MKTKARIFIAIFIPLLLVLAVTSPVLACIITISSDKASGNVGDILTFTINVQKTHRTCLVPIDETQIKLVGMDITSQTMWKQISQDVNQKQITVRLKESGEGSIEVIRICSKGGDDEIVKVTIKATPTTPPGSIPGQTLTPPDSKSTPVSPSGIIPAPLSIEPIPSSPGVTSSDSAQIPPIETTWWEAFVDGITQPYIIALLVLIILATISLIRGYRRLRYLILLASLSYLGFVIGGCPCVLGSLQNMIIRLGEMKYYMPTYLQIGIPVIGTIVFGRIFCGWVCPMGAVQHFIYRKEIGKKAKSFDASPRLHNVLRYGKYLFLVILVVVVVITQTTVFASIDPFKALFNLDFTFGIATILLIVLLIVSLFIGFPWCKYACPLGAFLGLFSKFTFSKVKISDKCTNCKACHTTFCDYRAIKPGEIKPEVNQVECMRCGECIARCPCKAMDFTA